MNESVSEPQGLCALIKQTASARRAGNADALNASLVQVGRLLEALFRGKIERRLANYRDASGGYSVTFEDACDVLNEILWIVCQRAEAFRGSTDAEAYAWLQTTIDRHVTDKGRTLQRRMKKWREIFRLAPKRLKTLLETNDARTEKR